MASFLERAAHSVNHIFSLFCITAVLVVSLLGFEATNLVLIAPVPEIFRQGIHNIFDYVISRLMYKLSR